jgi:hypothetical protein
MPPSVVVEYASRAGLLLWGMIERSRRGSKPIAGARPIIIGALGVVHTLAALVRKEERVAALLLFGIFVASMVLMISTWFGAALKLLPLGLVGVALCVLLARVVKSLSWIRTFAVVATLMATAAGIWLIVASRVTVRLPWGDRDYVVNLSGSEGREAAGSARRPAIEATATR